MKVDKSKRGIHSSGIIRLLSGNETVKAHLLTARNGKWFTLVDNRRYEDKMDWIMGIVAFAGAAVGVLLPFVLIMMGIGFYLPNLELFIVICQVAGCAMIVVGLGYFVCRKEI